MRFDPPRLLDASPGPGIEPGGLEETSRRLRIVLVDDHVIVREALADLLSRDPRFAVVGEASNGRDAVQMVRKEHPDVVLMDVVMPEIDGIQATRIIKSEWPDIAVVGLSMLVDEGTRQQMLEAGACAHLGKETELPVLLATLFGCAA